MITYSKTHCLHFKKKDFRHLKLIQIFQHYLISLVCKCARILYQQLKLQFATAFFASL